MRHYHLAVVVPSILPPTVDSAASNGMEVLCCRNASQSSFPLIYPPLLVAIYATHYLGISSCLPVITLVSPFIFFLFCHHFMCFPRTQAAFQSHAIYPRFPIISTKFIMNFPLFFFFLSLFPSSFSLLCPRTGFSFFSLSYSYHFFCRVDRVGL